MNAAPSSAGKLMRPLFWNTTGSFLRSGAGFALGVVLGRLLGPKPFGLVAAAFLPISLGQLLVDQGVSAELIQKSRISLDDLRHARSRQLLMGAALTLLMAILAPVCVDWYRMPDLLPVFWALAPLFLLQALGQVPMALMKRHMHFRRLQGIQVGSYLAGYLGLGVPMAMAGKGVWALVAAQWLQTLIQTGLLLLAHPVATDHSGSGEKDFLRPEGAFAWRVMAANLSSWGLTNLAALLIGRHFGAVDLGLYNRGRNLIQTPTGIAMVALQGVIFPATAKIQNDTVAVRITFLRAVRGLAWLIFPFLGCALAWAHPMVVGIYGAAWVGAVPLMVPLLAAMPFALMMGLPGPVLLGLGVASVELHVQLGLGLLMLPLLAWGGHLGLFPLLWMVVVFEAVRWALMTGGLLPRLGVAWRTYLGVLAWPVVAGLGVYAAAWTFEWSLIRAGLSPGLRLVAEGGLIGFMGAALWGVRACRLPSQPRVLDY